MKEGREALKCALSLHASLPSCESLADVDDGIKIRKVITEDKARGDPDAGESSKILFDDAGDVQVGSENQAAAQVGQSCGVCLLSA